MSEKKGFILYYDKRSTFEALIEKNPDGTESYENVGRLFMALCDYAENGKIPIDLDKATNVAFACMRPQIDADAKKYEKKCEQNRQNITMRWDNNRIQTNTDESHRIQVNTNYTDTDTDTETDTETETETETESEKVYSASPAEKHGADYREIVDYLNEKAGTNYKATSKATQRLINARLKEGFTVDQFKEVIDKKVADWGKDEKMSQYLRPETLFGTKFESYLNKPQSKCERDEYDFDIDDYI